MTTPAYTPPSAPVQPRNGMGTAALVLGIIALLLAWIPLIGFIGFILGALAIVLGIIGIVRARKGRATNLAVAAVGTGLGAVAFVLSTVVFGLFATAVNDQINAPGSVVGTGITPGSPPAVPGTPPTVAFGQGHTWGGGETIAISAPREFTPDNPFLQASSGKRFAAVDVTVHNGSSRPYQVMMAQLTAQHSGRVAQENYTAGDPLPNTEVPPGGETTFTKVWEVDEQPGELQVSVKPNPVAGQTVFFNGEF
ncbi:DUF4352 domain-containing protein [Saccharopolyspora flava]|uniref:DUF4352 domain-containing protein n=1 Tax=Saccharopolyspora flava TaxID=95161 RepID=A0A1I6RMK0_9PSEU|nr:DUF4352 domain-containing protein [Saccharopolyspora flava]SFS65961.1 protein of unknown function [Saccharopolyspora flava]